MLPPLNQKENSMNRLAQADCDAPLEIARRGEHTGPGGIGRVLKLQD